MRIYSFRRSALGICAMAILAGCGASQPPLVNAPGAMPQISPIRVTPDKHETNVVGVYGVSDYSDTINGYKGTDPKNGPPTCTLKAPGRILYGNIAVDRKGNLIVPTTSDTSPYTGSTAVYEGPQLCGRELGSVQDSALRAAPTDAASLNAATGTIVIVYGTSISVCTLKSGCTRNLKNPDLEYVVGVALAKDGDCWTTGQNYDNLAAMIYFKGCKGSGQVATGFMNTAPGGLDIDTKGNLVSVDATRGFYNTELWVYRGCNPSCTVVGGPFSLRDKTNTTFGHLNSAGTEFVAGNELYNGGLDVYKYSTKGLTYDHSITNGLSGSFAAAFAPGSRQ